MMLAWEVSMERVFISYKFRQRDRGFSDQVKRLVESHGLTPVDGKYLDGGPVAAGVNGRLEGSDALIALFVSPHDVDFSWLVYEMTTALNNNIPCIGVYEVGFPVPAPFAHLHRWNLDSNLPLDCFLDLSTTLGNWKRDAGQRVTVRLLPDNIAKHLTPGGRYRARYRTVGGTAGSNWQDFTCAEEGTRYIFKPALKDGHSLEVEAEINGITFSSPRAPQHIPIELEPKLG